MNKIEFTGESLRSAEDLERLIKEAKFEVEYYKNGGILQYVLRNMLN